MFAPAISSIVMSGGCSDDDILRAAQVRVIHASHDAPPVNSGSAPKPRSVAQAFLHESINVYSCCDIGVLPTPLI
jgi:hypothetical protein